MWISTSNPDSLKILYFARDNLLRLYDYKGKAIWATNADKQNNKTKQSKTKNNNNKSIKIQMQNHKQTQKSERDQTKDIPHEQKIKNYSENISDRLSGILLKTRDSLLET